jgi:triosephosphate isomerase (TIM)
MRKPMIAGNWKMHTKVMDACSLAAEVAKAYTSKDDREVVLAPPFTVLSEVSHVTQNSSIIISSQNVCWKEEGAFTGEISPTMVKDAGGSAAILGHSERRQIFKEDDELINKRIRGAINFGLLAIFCIGETLEEREGNITFEVLERQIQKGLEGVEEGDMGKVVIAYEPVWAIGTGKTATKEQAQEAHTFIRQLIEKMYEKSVAENLRILYGGSVKPDNIDDLMAQEDIDGALVGGAALDAESFGRIINFQNR